MRKLIFLIACILVQAGMCYAQSVTEIIEGHRQWMTANYPNTETLSEGELLKEAALSVIYGLREPEAKALLSYAAKTVPQLNNYVAWLDSNKPDYKFVVSIAAMKALLDAAETRLGIDNDVTAWCRYLCIDQMSNMQDVVPQAEQAIDIQERAVKKHPTCETKALLYLMKLQLFNVKLRNTLLDDPKDYESLFDTESKILSIYPPNDTTATLTHAKLYFELGVTKQNVSDNEESRLAQSNSEVSQYSIFTPLSSGATSNAPFYIENAIELLEKFTHKDTQ